MNWSKETAKGIEKYIDPSKLDIETIPDIDDDTVGKVLSVNEDLEPVWIKPNLSGYDDSDIKLEISITKERLEILVKDLDSYKDEMTDYQKELATQIEVELGKISASISEVESLVTQNKELFDKYVGDNNGIIADIYSVLHTSNTAIDVLKERIDLFVESRDVVGAYVCGNNNTPTRTWCNMMDPFKNAKLDNFLFEQDSGWVMVDQSKLDCRLMFSSEQSLTINDLFDLSDEYARVTIEAWIQPFSNSESNLMDYLFLYDDSGFLRIKTTDIDIRTNTSIPTYELTHVVFAFDSSIREYNIYVNGVKIQTFDTVYSDTFILPSIVTLFSSYEGYVSSFRIYNSKLDEKTIKNNYSEGYLGFNYYKQRILGAFEGRSAESIYTNSEYIISKITVLKDSISLKVDSKSYIEDKENMTQLIKENESEIKILKDEISLKVSESYVSNSIDTAKKELQDDIAAVDSRVDTILDDVGGALADGIIDEAESNMIKIKLLDFNREKQKVEEEYNNLYTNVDLSDECKTNLNKAFVDYTSKFNTLITVINTIISDGKATEEEKTNYVNSVNAYNDSFKTLSSKLYEALDDISVSRGTAYIEQLNQMKDSIDSDMVDISKSVTDLTAEMNGAFKDGIVTEIEKKAISERLVALNKEKQDVDIRYITVCDNTDFEDGDIKTSLATAKTTYDNVHQNLSYIINKVVEDNKVTEEEKNTIDATITQYNNALTDFHKKLDIAIDHIAEKKAYKSLNSAKAYADEQIGDVYADLASLNNTINTTFKDGIISEAEALAISSNIDLLNVEKIDIDKMYDTLQAHELLDSKLKTELTTDKTTYDNAHANLITLINSAIADRNITTEEKNNVNTAFTNYSTALSELKVKFNECLENINDSKVGEVKAEIKILKDSISLKVDGEVYDKEKTEIINKIDTMETISVYLSNETQVIATDSSRYPLIDKTYSVNITVYKGTTDITSQCTITAPKTANGIVVSKPSFNVIDFSVDNSIPVGSPTAHDGYFNIDVLVGEVTYTKKFSWAITKQGNDGNDGKDGTSVTIKGSYTADEWKNIKDTLIPTATPGDGYLVDGNLWVFDGTTFVDCGSIKGQDGENAQFVKLNGEQVFKYTNNFNSTPTPTSITISCLSVNISNPTYQWSYKKPGSDTYVYINQANSSKLVIAHDASMWGDDKQLTFRCTCNLSYDEITIIKISDGEDGRAYRVEIVSTNGNIFKNGNISTTLSAVVYKNEVNITDLLNASSFKWKKINKDGTLDTAWNTAHFGGTKTVTITSSDVFARASFVCEIDI